MQIYSVNYINTEWTEPTTVKVFLFPLSLNAWERLQAGGSCILLLPGINKTRRPWGCTKGQHCGHVLHSVHIAFDGQQPDDYSDKKRRRNASFLLVTRWASAYRVSFSLRLSDVWWAPIEEHTVVSHVVISTLHFVAWGKENIGQHLPVSTDEVVKLPVRASFSLSALDSFDFKLIVLPLKELFLCV